LFIRLKLWLKKKLFSLFIIKLQNKERSSRGSLPFMVNYLLVILGGFLAGPNKIPYKTLNRWWYGEKNCIKNDTAAIENNAEW
jgi:hypothetical protein